MRIRIVQLVVDRDISSNLAKILAALGTAEIGEWVIFPEAVLSGYYPDEHIFTAGLSWERISNLLEEIKEVVERKLIHCILGTATRIDGVWRNTVLSLDSTAKKDMHHKIHLSKLDKNHFQSGKTLEVYETGGIQYGLLACRELLFPALWSELKSRGAQIVFHLNNAVQPHDALWKHILITRAIENSIYVVSVNNAASPQTLASYIIDPTGEVIIETQAQIEQSVSSEINLDKVIANLAEREDY